MEKVTIYDSYKIIPLAVEKIPKAFNLKDKKLEIDYLKPRKKRTYINKRRDRLCAKRCKNCS